MVLPIDPAIYEVDIRPGERLKLPSELLDQIGPGRWRVTVEPIPLDAPRVHAAFLNSYAPEDEGLYDDDSPVRNSS